MPVPQPKPYLAMSRTELDRQYDACATVGDITPYLDQYRKMSADARRDLDFIGDISFGATKDEVFDFFPAGSNAPVFVFIHGGYWRLLSKDDSAFLAKCFVDRGISVAALNYSLAPQASLDEIVRQIRFAIAHIWREATSLYVDRDRIFLGGSSAGGHLVGMALSDTWQDVLGVPKNIVAGAMAASGLYDLEPVRLCHPNEWLNLESADAYRNSPINHLPAAGCKLLVTWAGSETDEFKRQSRDYADVWKAAGFPVSEFEIPDRNHFDIILDLADHNRALTHKVFEMIELA